jgi:cyclophilin family peptidyl-prolyl cis-trans isomerase
MQNLTWAAIGACGLALLAEPARAVTITLWTNNIVMGENRTFQMPITASDPDGQPLKFAATVSNKKLTAVFAPSSNRSLLINVSGVDSNNNPFTSNLVVQLFEDLTPLTTARIIDLVNSNFYNGLLFQRVISGFVAQGGGAATNLNLESGVTIDDEYVASLIYDGFGQLGMANQAPTKHDSNDSQFFITDVDLSIGNTNHPSPEYLNFLQPIFGQLTSGFNVLAEIMSTPVGTNPDTGEISEPLSNVVMNTVTVITNSQDAVLRLTAAPKFPGASTNSFGAVTVTVSATNAENQVATQTFQVNVIVDTSSSPPFLGPIPAGATVTQDMATSFILTVTNIDTSATFFVVTDLATGAYPTNMDLSRDSHTGRVWVNPDVTLTGTASVSFGVSAAGQSTDTHVFVLNVLPRSATPTMTIVPLKGSFVDAGVTNHSSISVTGTFAFNSQSDQTFSSNDVMELDLGDPSNPFSVTLTPNLSGYKVRNGSISGKARLSATTSSEISAQFNIAKNTFAISAHGIEFPSPGLTNNEIQIGVSIGSNYGTDLRPWVEIKPGVFVPPAPFVTGSP